MVQLGVNSLSEKKSFTSVKSLGEVLFFLSAEFLCLEANAYSAMEAVGSSRFIAFIKIIVL